MTPIPLYWKGGHSFLRKMTLGILSFGGVCCVGLAIVGIASGQFGGILFIPLFALMAMGIARTTLRAQEVFGDERGLWVRQGTQWRPIAWKDVEDIDYPLSSMNPVFRVYRIWVKGEPPIHFMPDSEQLAAIEQFRREAK